MYVKRIYDKRLQSTGLQGRGSSRRVAVHPDGSRFIQTRFDVLSVSTKSCLPCGAVNTLPAQSTMFVDDLA